MYYALKKEGNPAICYNINVAGVLYSKWNKPNTERQIWSHLDIECLKKNQTHRLIVTEKRMMVARGCTKGKKRAFDQRV